MRPFDLDRIGRDLPFAAALPALRGALAAKGTAVVQAPPGTGKTTLVPPAVASVDGVAGRVVVTQPRRVAARSAARRLATLTGTEIGTVVGYSVRGDSLVGRDTLVEFVTPGVLVRRLVADPDLPGIGAVVLDEVHERDVESDLAFALLCELRQLRDDLPVVAMSATVEAGRFARLLGGPGPDPGAGGAGAGAGSDAGTGGAGAAPVVGVPDPGHPLEVRYAPAPVARLDARGVTDGFLEHVAAVTADEVSSGGADALVFLPGVREIDRVVRSLTARLGDRAEVLPLHGGLDAAAQDRAVSGTGRGRGGGRGGSRVSGGDGGGTRPRVVVSTDLAESSLTVPGVRVVVDACLSREPRRDAARDMTGLVTVSASRDSCVQRAGRAARLGPGVAVRCLSEDDFARLPDHRTPAIATSDLTTFALDVACWGAPRGEGLALPDPPPAGEITRAQSVLEGLGALDARGRATARGRELARVPADPRHARALLDGAPLVGRRVAAEVVALLASGRRSPAGDLVADLQALRGGRAADSGTWEREARRLERFVGSAGAGRGRSGVPVDEAVGVVVSLAHPDRVARRRGGQYTFASGTGAVLPPGSALAGHEWLAVAEVGRASGRAAGEAGAVIRAAAALDREGAERAAEGLLDDDETATFSGGALTGRRIRRLGAIELSVTPVRPGPAAALSAVAAAVRAGGLPGLGPDDDALRLWRRMALAHRMLGAPWPDVSADALADRLEEWLAPEVNALARGAKLTGRDLGPALRRLLPWPEATRFDELLPDRLKVPSSSSYRVDYPEPGSDEAPVLAVKLQECFGWTSSPRICHGRVPVTVHLLSPAGRPLAVTRDLEFFWREAYPGVRAEMRGRYPRHPWPEDPMAAEPTRRTNPRR
ncbi:ATP-dependent helicase C-terminal domain-containing protein [Rhodococcus sp. IEGM 1408]|nr:ATP-dependent helicase C-terminal domain-containing protein [Rhodococcus sp. IEGM 1408]MDV8002329.1 ATP-dependent helicase C-terminal domain-containing protein [Rhodococcus sp. IEGM 1408]